jgi:hypothetical protein
VAALGVVCRALDFFPYLAAEAVAAILAEMGFVVVEGFYVVLS